MTDEQPEVLAHAIEYLGESRSCGRQLFEEVTVLGGILVHVEEKWLLTIPTDQLEPPVEHHAA